jgi:two-component system NtrC family sensor kinase
VGLLCVLLYAVAGWLLAGYPFARALVGNLALIGSASLPLVIILRRQRWWTGCHRLFWNTIGAGIGLWIVGHVGWAADALVSDEQPWLRWHTVFSLSGGIAPLIALLARPHGGVRPHAPATVGIDLAANGLLAVFVYTYLVLVPSLVPSMLDEARDRLLLLIQIHRALLLGGFAGAAWISRGTDWQATYLRLATGAAIGFVLRFGTSLAIQRGNYEAGSLYDLAWIIPWLCYAWAALEAPASERAEQAIDAGDAPAPIAYSAIPVLLIPSIGYGMLYLDGAAQPTDSFRILLTSVTTVCGLALLTMRMAAQGGELQRADARLKLLAAAIEQTGDPILITRADGAFEHANEAFRRALGYTRREIDRLSFSELMEAGPDQPASSIPQQVKQHGIWRGTLQRRRKDGSAFPAACTVVGLRNATGRIAHFVTVERDISEELRLRDQLVHSERLSAIGELVAGVAHEINNPLQTIIGSVELMLDERPDAINRRDLELVRREAARAGQIVRNLLTFVRRGSADHVQADLNQIVRTTVELRQYHLAQNNIAVVATYAPSRLPVLVNRDEIQRVVLNLLLNAEQAIVVSARSGTIAVSTSSDGAHHIVEILDSGRGVNPGLRGRIFEPFFTTKEVGEGTGLGLSLSHGIASAHHGSLELLDSATGARFRLTLPAHSPPASETLPAHPAGSALALVVDDEASIRTLLRRLLERRGFQVLEAESGDEAARIAQEQALSVVFCDVRMPGLAGPDLYRVLASRNPDVRARFIFVTGDTLLADHADLAGVPRLAKPFTAADLDALLTQLGIR